MNNSTTFKKPFIRIIQIFLLKYLVIFEKLLLENEI